MKICLFIDNFTPDLGASSFRFESIVKELSNRGHKIKIIASYPNRISMKEFVEFKYNNVEIVRINKNELKPGTIQRAFNYLNYFIQAIKVGIKESKESELIIATSPQLFVGVAGALVSKINRKNFLIDVRDLWPDIVLDMNVMKKYNPIYLFLKILEKFMYNQSRYLVYNSPGFRSYLEKKYDNEKMTLVTNGIDDFILDYFGNREVNIQIKEKYQILYAGNLGIAQDIKILVDLAKKRNDIEVLLLGKGSQENLIKEKIKELNLKNINLISSVPRNELLKFYEKADILFLQLKDIKMFEKTIPSKIFEYLATQKPILYGVEGVAKEILMKEFNRKYYFKANNIDDLEEKLDLVINDIEAKTYLKPDIEKLRNSYSRKILSQKYAMLIEKVF